MMRHLRYFAKCQLDKHNIYSVSFLVGKVQRKFKDVPGEIIQEVCHDVRNAKAKKLVKEVFGEVR